MKYTDPDGEWFITALFTLANMWLSTSAANDWQFNPAKWDWGSPKTWVTLGQSGISGFKMGSSVEYYVKDRIMDFRINRLENKLELINSPNYTASLQEDLGYNQTNGLFIKDEKLDYNFMWRNANLFETEYGALITPNGVLITPTYLNSEREAELFGYFRNWWDKGSLFVEFNNRPLQIIGAIHTHQAENSLYGYRFSGADDFNTLYMKGLPDFVMNRYNTAYAQYAAYYAKEDRWFCKSMKLTATRNDILEGFSLIKFILTYGR